MARTIASTISAAHKRSLRSTTTLVALVAAAAGCSSDAQPDESTDTDKPAVYAGAQPCVGFDTGYPGDEYCIAPPDPDKGFQLHYGPKDWNDPQEVEKYFIYPAEETTDCLFLKTPNTETVYTNQYHGRMRPGSHHMITYTQADAVPDSTEPGDCRQGPSSRFLLGAQEPVIDIVRDDNAPEQRGYAMKLEPTLQAAIQLHYVNTTDKPQVKEAWVNLLYADPAQVTTLVEPIFWLGGLDMAVPPGAREIIKGECVTPPGAPDDLHMVQVTGHYHANTVRFSAWKTSATGERVLIYESYDYQHPGFTYFNSQDINPVPDSTTRQYGGTHNGALYMKAGDKIEWECEVDNQTNVTLRFANGVYDAEMCNMFGTYAPSMGAPWACYNM
jgi:hypothetical protein